MTIHPAEKMETVLPMADACWSTIGVAGDLSCPELERHTHCRNCPRYASAALGLLERDIPTDYRAERSAHFATEAQSESAEIRTAFIFRIATEWFALPVPLLEEVANPRVIHSLPHRRNGAVLGLVDIRGELLICISLAKLLGLEESTAEAGTPGAAYPRLVVIRHEGWRTVFPVSEVRGIHRYHERELSAVPVTVAKGGTTYTKAILPWEGKSVGFLNEDVVIHTLNRSIA